ncbi:hypothetical protein CARUB_v10007114mg [Capsella rubella]|uniref:RING-type E3 ubiquitin transferase n=2 Tax=Capsella rubella TaxID=81985 RepID=R0FA44_9BRAS|nr:hypothetical protein CARUB_v10007114mg [Capsella rubella]
MLTTTVIIFFILVFMVSLYFYSRRSNPSRHITVAITFLAEPSSTAVVTTHSGLNPYVIKSLPSFTFSAATAETTIECGICLSEFEDNDSGRILPNCKHMFHVNCIDMWFHSHSSCPLCRSLIEPFVGGVR